MLKFFINIFMPSKGKNVNLSVLPLLDSVIFIFRPKNSKFQV
jgi:hypothetical protein